MTRKPRHSRRPGPPHGRRPFRKEAPPSKERLHQMLCQCGIKLSERQLEQLWRYHNLLRDRNEDRDLTRIVGFENTVIKHYVDCMIVGDHVFIPSPIVDIGTGAGFPGIPLKIRYPNMKLTLAEPRPRRAEFLREAVRLLELKDVQVFDHKLTSESFKQPMKAAISRALETVDKTILRTTACLGPGGKLIFMKGPNADEELELAKTRLKDSFKIIQDTPYVLPGTSHQRRLIVVEIIRRPEGKLSKAEEEQSALVE